MKVMNSDCLDGEGATERKSADQADAGRVAMKGENVAEPAGEAGQIGSLVKREYLRDPPSSFLT
jgi:hypothetical protein